jgi:hypothetical protein
VPVRHHSPACAWHVDRLIRAIRPDAVLIEGPRDATHLIALLTHEKTRMPVAVYTTYVQRRKDEGGAEGSGKNGNPLRHAAYYPLCDYSPELAAIRAAAAIGTRPRFIDLTFPEMVESGRHLGEGLAQSLLEERHLAHSEILWETCRRVGARDPDDLWDQLYELDHDHRDTARFFQDVLGYCALARRDYNPAMLQLDGCAAREAAMAAAVAEEAGRVVVVTGGFHTVALPGAAPALPGRVEVDPKDALVTLMRYGFEQLDRLNGYASGMPAPEFYQRTWEEKPVTGLIVELAREARRRNLGVSVADEIAALKQVRRLAALRGHSRPAREDLLDGIRSVYIKGSDDMEGLPILALARKHLAGDRVGNVPPEAGVPPLVEDFRRTALGLKVELDRNDAREVSLDLYRNARARQLSRFFHRLRFLAVPFAEWVAGPDYVTGQRLERIKEVWKYRWSPATESTLIERSLYGSTLEEAAAGLVREQFAAAETAGQGRRADGAARLLLEACRMGLHRHTAELLERTSRLVAEDGSFVSLVRAIEQILVLHVSREPLEAHHLAGIVELAGAAYARACYLLPGLAGTSESDEKEVLDALNALQQAALTLGDNLDRRALRHDRLRELKGATSCPAVLRGAAVGLLFGDGELDPEALVVLLRGQLLSAQDSGHEGAAFLRGLLNTARSVLWLVPEVVQSLHEVFRDWEEDRFIGVLPELRLAFADLTPRECDQVARCVSHVAGEPGAVALLAAVELEGFNEQDLLRGVAVNRHVLELLRQDSLEDDGD